MASRLNGIEVCRVYDVPPWAIGLTPRPHLARLRWKLRHLRPSLVWS